MFNLWMGVSMSVWAVISSLEWWWYVPAIAILILVFLNIFMPIRDADGQRCWTIRFISRDGSEFDRKIKVWRLGPIIRFQVNRALKERHYDDRRGHWPWGEGVIETESRVGATLHGIQRQADDWMSGGDDGVNSWGSDQD